MSRVMMLFVSFRGAFDMPAHFAGRQRGISVACQTTYVANPWRNMEGVFYCKQQIKWGNVKLQKKTASAPRDHTSIVRLLYEQHSIPYCTVFVNSRRVLRTTNHVPRKFRPSQKTTATDLAARARLLHMYLHDNSLQSTLGLQNTPTLTFVRTKASCASISAAPAPFSHPITPSRMR